MSAACCSAGRAGGSAWPPSGARQTLLCLSRRFDAEWPGGRVEGAESGAGGGRLWWSGGGALPAVWLAGGTFVFASRAGEITASV